MAWPRFWTDDRIAEFRRLRATTLTLKQIAAEMGIRYWQVAHANNEYGSAFHGRRISRPVLDAVLGEVSLAHQVPWDEIVSLKRGKVGLARHHCMWLLRQRGYSYPEIGRAMGRDHSSVISGIRKHAARIAEHTREQSKAA
jgi:chromosomal replication initiation ATPase DnaA